MGWLYVSRIQHYAVVRLSHIMRVYEHLALAVYRVSASKLRRHAHAQVHVMLVQKQFLKLQSQTVLVRCLHCVGMYNM